MGWCIYKLEGGSLVFFVWTQQILNITYIYIYILRRVKGFAIFGKVRQNSVAPDTFDEFTLDSEIPSSPDTLRVLLTGFASMAWGTGYIDFRSAWPCLVVLQIEWNFFNHLKETNHTGLWDTELAWYSPSATSRICHDGTALDSTNVGLPDLASL